MKYEQFGLILMVTHACNLNCRYCYNGTKSARSMPWAVAAAALTRAVRSTQPNGTLELGFFGGEPLLEADLIDRVLDEAKHVVEPNHIFLRPSLTTNGTISTPAAWKVMTRPEISLCVSHDGLPEVHDRYRRHSSGAGSSQQVMTTICRLQDAGQEVRVAMVVRPDSVGSLSDGIAWLWQQGIRQIDLSLDLWTEWSQEDGCRLEQAIGRATDLWYAGLPDHSINWFDEKAARLAGLPLRPTARCGFGDGEVAVAPSGNLYPCERLIGEDRPDNPMRIPGHVLEGKEFLGHPTPGREAAACSACAIESQCSTFCRCSNYIRTGDPRRPDGLLCLWDRTCCREIARVLARLPVHCEMSLASTVPE